MNSKEDKETGRMINDEVKREDEIPSSAHDQMLPRPKTFMDIFRDPELLNDFIVHHCQSDENDQETFKKYMYLDGIDPSNVFNQKSRTNEKITDSDVPCSEFPPGEFESASSEKTTHGFEASQTQNQTPSSDPNASNPSVFIMHQNVNVNNRNVVMQNPPPTTKFPSPQKPNPNQKLSIALPTRQYNTPYTNAQGDRRSPVDTRPHRNSEQKMISSNNAKEIASTGEHPDGNTTVLSQMIGAQTNINVIVNQTIFDRHQNEAKILKAGTPISANGHNTPTISVEPQLSIEAGHLPIKHTSKAELDKEYTRSTKSRKVANKNKAPSNPVTNDGLIKVDAKSSYQNAPASKQRKSRSSQLTLQHLIGSNVDQQVCTTPRNIGQFQSIDSTSQRSLKQNAEVYDSTVSTSFERNQNLGIGRCTVLQGISQSNTGCSQLQGGMMNADQAELMNQRLHMLQQFKQRSALLQMRQNEASEMGLGLMGTQKTLIHNGMPLTLNQLKVLQQQMQQAQWAQQSQNSPSHRTSSDLSDAYLAQKQAIPDQADAQNAMLHYNQEPSPARFNDPQRCYNNSNQGSIPSMQVMLLQHQQQQLNQVASSQKRNLINSQIAQNKGHSSPTSHQVCEPSQFESDGIQGNEFSNMVGQTLGFEGEIDNIRSNQGCSLESLQQRVDISAANSQRQVQAQQYNRAVESRDMSTALYNNKKHQLPGLPMSSYKHGQQIIDTHPSRSIPQSLTVPIQQIRHNGPPQCYTTNQYQQMSPSMQQYSPNQNQPHLPYGVGKPQFVPHQQNEAVHGVYARQGLCGFGEVTSRPMRPRIISSSPNQAFYYAASPEIRERNRVIFGAAQQRLQSPSNCFVSNLSGITDNYWQGAQQTNDGGMVVQQNLGNILTPSDRDMSSSESALANSNAQNNNLSQRRQSSNKRSASNSTAAKGKGGGQAKRQKRVKGQRNNTLSSSPPVTAPFQNQRHTVESQNQRNQKDCFVTQAFNNQFIPNNFVYAQNGVNVSHRETNVNNRGLTSIALQPIDLLKQKIFQRVSYLNSLQQQGYDVSDLFADLRNKAAEAFAKINSFNYKMSATNKTTPAPVMVNTGDNYTQNQLNNLTLTPSARQGLALLPPHQQQQILMQLRQQDRHQSRMKLAELASLRNAQAIRNFYDQRNINNNNNACSDPIIQDVPLVQRSAVPRNRPMGHPDQRHSSSDKHPLQHIDQRKDTGECVMALEDGRYIRSENPEALNPSYQQLKQHYQIESPFRSSTMEHENKSNMVSDLQSTQKNQKVQQSKAAQNTSRVTAVKRDILPTPRQVSRPNNQLIPNVSDVCTDPITRLINPSGGGAEQKHTCDDKNIGTVTSSRTLQALELIKEMRSAANETSSLTECKIKSSDRREFASHDRKSKLLHSSLPRNNHTVSSNNRCESSPPRISKVQSSGEQSHQLTSNKESTTKLEKSILQAKKHSDAETLITNQDSLPPPSLRGSPYATSFRRPDGSLMWLSVGPLPTEKCPKSQSDQSSASTNTSDDKISEEKIDALIESLLGMENQKVSKMISRDGSPLNKEQLEFRRKLKLLDKVLEQEDSQKKEFYTPEESTILASRFLLGIGTPSFPETCFIPHDAIAQRQLGRRLDRLKKVAERRRIVRESKKSPDEELEEERRKEEREKFIEQCRQRRKCPDINTPFKNLEDMKDRLECYIAPYDLNDNGFKYDVSAYPPLESWDVEQRMTNIRQKFTNARRRHFKRQIGPLPHTDALEIRIATLDLERAMLEDTIKSTTPPARPIKIKSKPEPLPSHLDSLHDVIKMPKRVKVNGRYVFKFDETDDWIKYFAPVESKMSKSDDERESLRHFCEGL